MKLIDMLPYYDLINELIQSFIMTYHSFRIKLLLQKQQIIFNLRNQHFIKYKLIL